MDKTKGYVSLLLHIAMEKLLNDYSEMVITNNLSSSSQRMKIDGNVVPNGLLHSIQESLQTSYGNSTSNAKQSRRKPVDCSYINYQRKKPAGFFLFIYFTGTYITYEKLIMVFIFHVVFIIVFSLRKGLYRSDEGKERQLFFNFYLFEVLHLPILLYRQQLWCHERFGSLRSDIVECNRVIGNAA